MVGDKLKEDLKDREPIVVREVKGYASDSNGEGKYSLRNNNNKKGYYSFSSDNKGPKLDISLKDIPETDTSFRINTLKNNVKYNLFKATGIINTLTLHNDPQKSGDSHLPSSIIITQQKSFANKNANIIKVESDSFDDTGAENSLGSIEVNRPTTFTEKIILTDDSVLGTPGSGSENSRKISDIFEEGSNTVKNAELADKSKTSVPQVNIDEVLDNWKKSNHGQGGIISADAWSNYIKGVYKNSKYTNFMLDNTSGELYFNPLNNNDDLLLIPRLKRVFKGAESTTRLSDNDTVYFLTEKIPDNTLLLITTKYTSGKDTRHFCYSLNLLYRSGEKIKIYGGVNTDTTSGKTDDREFIISLDPDSNQLHIYITKNYGDMFLDTYLDGVYIVTL